MMEPKVLKVLQGLMGTSDLGVHRAFLLHHLTLLGPSGIQVNQVTLVYLEHLEILDIMGPKVNKAGRDHKETLVLQVSLVTQVQEIAPQTFIQDLLEHLETQGFKDIQDQKASKEIKEFLADPDLMVHQDQVVSKEQQERLSMDMGFLDLEEKRVNQETSVPLY